MEPAALNTFLDHFMAMASSGFGLIEGDVRYVLNALIVISVVLAGVQWALAHEAPLGPFFRKVLFVGLFAFLINNWNALATAINETGAMLGLRAGGDGLTLGELHNPGRVGQIGTELFGKTVALGEGMNIITDFVALATIYLAAFFVLIGFFVLALQMFVTLIAFKLGSIAAFVALPWGVFNGTAWIAERPLGWVASSAMRLFVLAFVASISISFVETLPTAFTLDAGGVLNILLFGLTMAALAWFAPQLAGDVMTGQPHLSAGSVVSGAATAAAYGSGAAYIASGAAASIARHGGSLLGRVGSAFSRGGASPPAKPAPAINYDAMRPGPSTPNDQPRES